MSKDITWVEAIYEILSSSATPLHYIDITKQIISKGLRTSYGEKPEVTVNSIIAGSIQHNGEESPFIRVAGGTFTLNTRNSPDVVVPKKSTQQGSKQAEQNTIVSSFGIFWNRDGVEWSPNLKLLGKKIKDTNKDPSPIDFSNQIGIYLLYDGREVIYVGRTENALGKRLYDHTVDRMSGRWDRFSWFGLLPVLEDGSLDDDLPDLDNPIKLIPVLEAILIEALEPRQNRKRGEDLGEVEYLQIIDPEIEKRKFALHLMKK